MTEEALRLQKPSSNFTVAISEAAQDTFSQYCLVQGQKDIQAIALLINRGIVNSLLTRPNTADLMTVCDMFNPINGPKACLTGEFIFGERLNKTAYRTASNGHKDLRINNRAVYPNVKRPWVCPIFNSVIGIFELQQQLPKGVPVKLNINDRFLDSLCLQNPRPTKVQKRDGKGKIISRIANSSEVNRRFRDKFRKG